MKKIILGLAVVAMSAFAMPNNEGELLLISKMAEKKAIVLATMSLDGDKKEQFGKLYDEYQQELAKVVAKKLDVIAEYAAHYNNLEAGVASKLMKKWADVQEEALKLQKNYVKKFEKFLSPVEVLRYMQVENRFRIAREFSVAKLVPLANPQQQAK
jgi:hypothetical protein